MVTAQEWLEVAADWSDVDAEPEDSASSTAPMATANLATVCARASYGADAKASPDAAAAASPDAAAAATRHQPGSPASVDAPVPQTGDRLAAEHAIVDDWVWPVRQVCEGGRPSRPIILDSLCAGTERGVWIPDGWCVSRAPESRGGKNGKRRQVVARAAASVGAGVPF